MSGSRIREVSIGAGGTALSGRLVVPSGVAPRALLVALHGGGMGAPYFDASEEISLLELGARLGFAVLALDRPGYGASKGLSPEHLDLVGQSALVRVAIERARAEHAPERGVFLVGHSFGAMLAVRIASERPDWLLGIEMGGAGVRYLASIGDGLKRRRVEGSHMERRGRVMSATPWRLSAESKDTIARAKAPVPAPEVADSRDWERTLREIAPRVEVPVRYSMPEHDEYWVVDGETLREVEALFCGAPFVEARIQRFADHVVSLHAVARAYHLGTLAFCEECVLHRRGPEPSEGEA